MSSGELLIFPARNVLYFSLCSNNTTETAETFDCQRLLLGMIYGAFSFGVLTTTRANMRGKPTSSTLFSTNRKFPHVRRPKQEKVPKKKEKKQKKVAPNYLSVYLISSEQLSWPPALPFFLCVSIVCRYFCEASRHGLLRANLSLETPMKTWCGEDSNKLGNLGWGSRFVWERDEGSSSTLPHTLEVAAVFF